ncbi:hypothetical protein QE152_g28525 [Popillia japonica]|uniref:Transposase n=1 Tax=Popillia japonica TaxID=7064 RepID=A0AAW1JIK1_POPJA
MKPGITEFRRQLAEQLVTKEVTIVQDLGPIPRKRLHAFIKPEGPGRKPRRPCQGCYQDLRKTMGSRDADRKVRRIAIESPEDPVRVVIKILEKAWVVEMLIEKLEESQSSAMIAPTSQHSV